MKADIWLPIGMPARAAIWIIELALKEFISPYEFHFPSFRSSIFKASLQNSLQPA